MKNKNNIPFRVTHLVVKIACVLAGFGGMGGVALKAQECTSSFQWTPVKTNNVIEWEKFPTFSLPFTIIYEGPRFGDTKSLPLSRGFSHLATFSGNESATLPFEQRAVTWYHVATEASSEPWADRAVRSPWGNNQNLYNSIWENQLRGHADAFQDSQGGKPLAYSIVGLDIERIFDTDREIAAIKNQPRIPEAYRSLTDAQFVERYKRDMQRQYAAPVDFLRKKSVETTKIGSYSDALIRGSFTNWLAMDLTTWKDWTTNANLLLHVMKDSTSGQPGGPFYNQLNLLTPSCYYYYDYNTSPLGKDYLAYLLFVIEANRVWSDKPVIPYIWMRYHDAFNPTVPFVPSFVAEATAIFPFFSGAKGLWLWEAPVDPSRQDNYASYEYFIGGLYRLSQFKEFFEGANQLVIPTPALESSKAKSAIWRGVVKGSNILIAAQNPYVSSDTQETIINVSFQNWQKTITLKGREVFLCSFDLNTITSVEEKYGLKDITVMPNPTHEKIHYRVESEASAVASVGLIDLAGKVYSKEEVLLKKGVNEREINASKLPTGTYLLQIEVNGKRLSEKVLIK